MESFVVNLHQNIQDHYEQKTKFDTDESVAGMDMTEKCRIHK